MNEEGAEGEKKLSETSRVSPHRRRLYPECGVAVTLRAPRRNSSKRIVVLHPGCTAASASRHETRIIYGAVRIEKNR